MTIQDLDALIRETMPDGENRRNILTDLGDLSEGINQVLIFLLAVQGYVYNHEDDTWKQQTTTKRQVNPSLR